MTRKWLGNRWISTTSHPSISTFRNRSVSLEVRRVHTWRSVKSHSHSFPQYRASRTRVPLQPLAHQSCTPPYSKTEANFPTFTVPTLDGRTYISDAESSDSNDSSIGFQTFRQNWESTLVKAHSNTDREVDCTAIRKEGRGSHLLGRLLSEGGCGIVVETQTKLINVMAGASRMVDRPCDRSTGVG